MMSALGYGLYESAMHNFRTNNVIIDTLVAALLSGMMGLVFAYYEKIISGIKSWIAHARLGNQHVLKIPRIAKDFYGLFVGDRKDTPNQDFINLLWYITHMTHIIQPNEKYNIKDSDSDEKVHMIPPHCILSLYAHGCTLLKPDENATFTLPFRSFLIKITLKCAPPLIPAMMYAKPSQSNDEAPKQDNEYFVLSIVQKSKWSVLDHGKRYEDIVILHDFIKMIRDKREEIKMRETWRPVLYRIFIQSETVSSCNIRWSAKRIINHKNFHNVILDKHIHESLLHDLHQFMQNKEWYKELGVPYKRGYLFHGPPGTGKTSIIQAICNETQSHIYTFDLGKLSSDDALDSAFDMIPDKCILLMEDIDCASDIVLRRDIRENKQREKSAQVKKDDKEIKESEMTLSTLLNHLDGIGNVDGRIIIMTTNHPEHLDPALVRPGRVDMQFHLDFCSHYQIMEILKLYFPKYMNDIACFQETERLVTANQPYSKSPAFVTNMCLYHSQCPENAIKAIVAL